MSGWNDFSTLISEYQICFEPNLEQRLSTCTECCLVPELSYVVVLLLVNTEKVTHLSSSPTIRTVIAGVSQFREGTFYIKAKR